MKLRQVSAIHLTFIIVILFGCEQKTSKNYYENGQLKTEVGVKNGKADGVAKFYNEDGQLKEEDQYKDGKLDGLLKGYYNNGNVEWEKNYKDGKKNGVHKEYYESGKLKIVANFKNNVQNGLTTEYYESGQLHSEINFKFGVKDGELKIYYENGTLKSHVIYKNGKEIYAKNCNKQGEITDEIGQAIVTLSKDTIELGEENTAQIELPGFSKVNGNADVFFVRNKNGNRKNKKVIKMENSRATYQFKTDSTGEYHLVVEIPFTTFRGDLGRTAGIGKFIVMDKKNLIP